MITTHRPTALASEYCVLCGTDLHWLPTRDLFTLSVRRDGQGNVRVIRDHVRIGLQRDERGEFVIVRDEAVRWSPGAVGLRYTRHLCVRPWRWGALKTPPEVPR